MFKLRIFKLSQALDNLSSYIASYIKFADSSFPAVTSSVENLTNVRNLSYTYTHLQMPNGEN